MAGKPKGGARPGSGRKPKADEAKIRDLMSPYIPNAIETVLDIMENGKRESDRLAAAKLALAYVFGNPQTKVEHSGNAFEKVNINIMDAEG